MLKNKSFRAGLIALLLFVVIFFVSPVSLTYADEISEIRIGIGHLPVSMNPHREGSLMARGPVYSLIFEGLVTIDDDGNTQPALAKSYELIDENTWEFKLREDVTFHTGEKFDAHSVQWNIKYTSIPAQSKTSAELRNVKEVEVIDDYTLRIHTSRPDADLIFNLERVYMLPREYFEEDQTRFHVRPSGTGPFKVVEYIPESKLVLEKFEDSWHDTLPPVRKIEFRHMPMDFTRASSLEVGDIDIAYTVPLELVDRLEDRGFNVISSPVGQSMVVNFRQTLGGPISDIRVRRALSYAVNVDEIIDTLLMGRAEKLMGQYVGPDAFGFNPNIEPYPYDPEKAKQLLAEAGYGENGETLELTMVGSEGRYMKDKDIALAILSYFKDVGVELKIEFPEAGVWLERLLSAKMPELYPIGMTYAPAMNAGTRLSIWHRSDVAYAMDDPEVNRLIDEQAKEMNLEKRKQMVQDILERFRDDPVAIYLYRIPGIYGLAKNISNVRFKPNYGMDLSQIVMEK